jgi:hypothetical protein
LALSPIPLERGGTVVPKRRDLRMLTYLSDINSQNGFVLVASSALSTWVVPLMRSTVDCKWQNRECRSGNVEEVVDFLVR